MFGKKKQLTNIELKYIETLLLKQIELLEALVKQGDKLDKGNVRY